ncbi:MAG TPA: plastocyanin/azurin family copper-binding protein [Candidatus Acidoferrales bacterium]|nr:plastocyanin/azurin family copper-binding protein [Candidatus Acidoferrales bacterium]
MKLFRSARFSVFLPCMFALAIFAVPQAVRAQQTWQASVGAESKDMGRQALAFLPNEIWIHVGDSITWTFQSDEIHTLTFLTPGQGYPPFQGPGAGCPGFSSSGAAFNGSSCVTSPPLVKGQAFTVMFSKAGTYKFECLVHPSMFGVIHVLNVTQPLPHGQDFYNDQAAAQRKALLTDTDQKMEMDGEHDSDDAFSVSVISHKKHVIAGRGEISSTPGGNQTMSIVRFLKGTIEIHVGDTVEWANYDPDEPHTITFGAEPPPPTFPFPSANVTVDPDGTPHATITSPSDNVHSGFIAAILEDEPKPGPPGPGYPTNPISPTRFRVTFTQPGTYPYRCVLHDNLGMVGKVVVLP